jgi:hypothetical protein
MTNRFRADYGAADKGDGTEGDLPLDEIHGLAWQMKTCVSVRRVWLGLPISLTVVTAALAIWTIATNWRRRYSRPVWKDSILPLLFYGRDIVDGALDKYKHDSNEQTQNANHTKNPLETSNMK